MKFRLGKFAKSVDSIRISFHDSPFLFVSFIQGINHFDCSISRLNWWFLEYVKGFLSPGPFRSVRFHARKSWHAMLHRLKDHNRLPRFSSYSVAFGCITRNPFTFGMSIDKYFCVIAFSCGMICKWSQPYLIPFELTWIVRLDFSVHHLFYSVHNVRWLYTNCKWRIL